jgi:hypothetical protein
MGSVGIGRIAVRAAEGGVMAIDHRLPHTTHLTPQPAVRRHRPRWGYLSRSVSRYGVISTTLVIYSPDTTERERRQAEISRCYAPTAVGAGVVAWVALVSAGLPPLVAAILLVALLVPGGVLLARRARPVRERAAALWSVDSAFRTEDEGGLRRRRLEALGESMQDSATAYMDGMIGFDRFQRVWRATYAHALAGSSATMGGCSPSE